MQTCVERTVLAIVAGAMCACAARAPGAVIDRDGGASSSVDGPTARADASAPIDEGLRCPPERAVATGCREPLDENAAGLCNGLDDDCDGVVDERCPCEPGAVQACSIAAPGRARTGACSDGMQRCRDLDEFGGEWGPCEGGIAPASEICNGADDDCNGCTDELEGCTPVGTCPGPGDPRVPDGAPFRAYPLDGEVFYSGPAAAWRWEVRGGPCDAVVPDRTTFLLERAQERSASFTPRLSGDYTVTVTVTRPDGSVFTCTWIVHVRGPGLRIEMCYPESERADADLYVHRPGSTAPWFGTGTAQPLADSNDVCGWHNCEVSTRGLVTQRANWGYAPSPLAECVGAPHGASWTRLGHCANPRLDIDNNLVKARGSPENINIDRPRDGESFRIMVANFTGHVAIHPIVNVYCGGRLVSTLGAPPDVVPGFVGNPGISALGAMWRAADVEVEVDAAGNTVGCTVRPIRPPGRATGYWVTYDDGAY